jgi:hypothetical protein
MNAIKYSEARSASLDIAYVCCFLSFVAGVRVLERIFLLFALSARNPPYPKDSIVSLSGASLGGGCLR